MEFPKELNQLMNNLNKKFSCSEVIEILNIIGETSNIALIEDFPISHPDESGPHSVLDPIPGVICFGRLANYKDQATPLKKP